MSKYRRYYKMNETLGSLLHIVKEKKELRKFVENVLLFLFPKQYCLGYLFEEIFNR